MKPQLSCAPRTAVAYARYSSAGQRDVSIEQQLDDIRAYAQREGYSIVHEFADHARSGFKNVSARTEFQAMISAAASGSFDTVLCWKVDRFGRSRADSATYKNKLARLGVSVVYVMEPIPDGAAGVLTEGMLEAIAEWYSRNLSENVTRGMLDNARKCLWNGTKILGYSKGPDNHYVINESEAALIRRIFSRYNSGYSSAVIARELNASGLRTSRGTRFRDQSVLRIISNERYCGTYIWGSVRIPDGMPAIITKSDWEAAQKMKQKTARHVEQRTEDFLLTGKAFCGLCGHALIGDSGTSKSGATYYYYTCQQRKNRSGCTKHSVRKNYLEDLVVDFIMDHCFTEAEMDRMVSMISDEMTERRKKSPLASMKKELSDVTSKIDNINNAIAAGVYSDTTVVKLRALESSAADLRKAIGLQEYSESQMIDPDRIRFFLSRFARLNRDDPEDRRKIINVFLNSVYVYEDHLKIITNAVEGAELVPFEDLPADPSCSSNSSSGVLVKTHPNTVMFSVHV